MHEARDGTPVRAVRSLLAGADCILSNVNFPEEHD